MFFGCNAMILGAKYQKSQRKSKNFQGFELVSLLRIFFDLEAWIKQNSENPSSKTSDSERFICKTVLHASQGSIYHSNNHFTMQKLFLSRNCDSKFHNFIEIFSNFLKNLKHFLRFQFFSHQSTENQN